MLKVTEEPIFATWDDNYAFLPLSGSPEEIRDFTRFLVSIYEENKSKSLLKEVSSDSEQKGNK